MMNSIFDFINNVEKRMNNEGDIEMDLRKLGKEIEELANKIGSRKVELYGWCEEDNLITYKFDEDKEGYSLVTIEADDRKSFVQLALEVAGSKNVERYNYGTLEKEVIKLIEKYNSEFWVVEGELYSCDFDDVDLKYYEKMQCRDHILLIEYCDDTSVVVDFVNNEIEFFDAEEYEVSVEDMEGLLESAEEDIVLLKERVSKLEELNKAQAGLLKMYENMIKTGCFK